MKVNSATQAKLVEIAAAIRKAREKAGVSQAALATRIGMQRENLIRVEKGRGNLTVETLMRIAEGLGVELRVTFVRPRQLHADSMRQVPGTVGNETDAMGATRAVPRGSRRRRRN